MARGEPPTAHEPRLDPPAGVRDPGRRRAPTLLAGAAPLLAAAGRAQLALPAAAAPGSPSTLAQAVPTIVKPLPPEWFIVRGTNAETRCDALAGQGYVVPGERFSSATTPRRRSSTPRAGGCGCRAPGCGGRSSTYDQLRARPSRTTTAVIECAGNGRSFFAGQQGTPAGGTAWRLGGVGAARWRGVPLASLLYRAGLRCEAVDVMPVGLDASVVSGGCRPGPRPAPAPGRQGARRRARRLEMNGEPLPPDHGFPARLLVPGWVGIASVKWPGSIEVADHPLTSPWNTTSYRMIGPDHPADSPPLTTQPPRSAFELAWEAEVPAGRPLTLRGRSWSGTGGVHRVDVSTDGGATWRQARLEPRDPAGRGCGGACPGCPLPAVTSCSPAPPASTAWPSPTPCRSTSWATSSGRSSGIPWSPPETARPGDDGRGPPLAGAACSPRIVLFSTC